MEDVKEKLGEAADKAKEAVSEAAHDAKNAVKDAAHDVKNAAKDVAADAKNAVKDIEAEAKRKWPTALSLKGRGPAADPRLRALFLRQLYCLITLIFTSSTGTLLSLSRMRRSSRSGNVPSPAISTTTAPPDASTETGS